MNKKFIASILLILMLLGFTGCTNTNANNNLYTATVEADSYFISSNQSGKIASINFKQGDKVTKGQAIVIIDNSYYSLQVKIAQAALDAAKAQKSSAILSDDQITANIDSADAQLSIAKLHLNDCNILSPVDGIVEDAYLNAGENVNPGVNIAKIMKQDDKYIKVYVEESKRNLIKMDESITLYKNGSKVGSGKVSYISPEDEFTPKNTETKSEKDKTVFEVKIDIPKDFDAVPGMMIDAEIK